MSVTRESKYSKYSKKEDRPEFIKYPNGFYSYRGWAYRPTVSKREIHRTKLFSSTGELIYTAKYILYAGGGKDNYRFLVSNPRAGEYVKLKWKVLTKDGLSHKWYEYLLYSSKKKNTSKQQTWFKKSLRIGVKHKWGAEWENYKEEFERKNK